MCIQAFEGDQENLEDQDALDNEIAIIRAQLGYCLQKLGKIEEALKLYNSVLKTKYSYILLIVNQC
jgi:tetratricopeptide (TPR) repeat protein